MRRRVSELLPIALAAVLVCGVSCDTKNVARGGVIVEHRPPTVSVPAEMYGNREATWSVAWIGGQGPFTVTWDFGGGAENIGPIPATSPNIQTVMMINPSRWNPVTYSYNVAVIDSQGRKSEAWSDYTVSPIQNEPPIIVSLEYSNRTLYVTVSEEDGDDVTVTPSRVPGLEPTPLSVVVRKGNGSVGFIYEADDLFAGASGTTVITADDGIGGVDTAEVEVSIPALELLPDTIYVLPMVHAAAVGDPVTFVCATGELPNPFQYLNGVSLTIEDDADYVSNSYNVGKRGGSAGDVDGEVWTAVNPSGFLLADNLIQATEPSPFNSIPEGRARWQFNATGLGGVDVTGVKGHLFNFQFTFGAAGLKHVGLQAVDTVNRTYYSDSTSTEYLWGTLMADEYGNLNVTGVDNTVLVK